MKTIALILILFVAGCRCDRTWDEGRGWHDRDNRDHDHRRHDRERGTETTTVQEPGSRP